MTNMDVTIRDSNFNIIGIVDDYESVIWTERYNTAGDFELYGNVDSTIAAYCKIGYYANINGSDTTMIIEKISMEDKTNSNNKITVTGRSVESILDRRVVWAYTNLTGNFQNAIKTLLNQNVINPAVEQRKIPNFSFKTSSDSEITSLSFAAAQYDGENLYDVISQLCQAFDVGFRVTNRHSSFIFELFKGKNRSYSQSERPFIIFSKDLDNLIESRFEVDNTPYKNVALVTGEGEANDKFKVAAGEETSSGLDRYETCVASGVSSKLEDGSDMPAAQYAAAVKEKGEEALKETTNVYSIDGKVDTESFRYGVDYYIGDYLQFTGIFGVDATVRVTEYIRCQDTKGYQEYPSYELIS